MVRGSMFLQTAFPKQYTSNSTIQSNTNAPEHLSVSLGSARGEALFETIKERDPVPKWYDPEKLRL